MIAEVFTDVFPPAVRIVGGTGLVALVLLIVMRARGLAVLRVRRADGFAKVDALMAFAFFVFFFFVYGLCQGLVLDLDIGPVSLGTAGRWTGLIAAVLLVVGGERLILRRFFRQRSSPAASIGEGLWVTWAVMPLVFGLLFVVYSWFGPAYQDALIDLAERRAGWQWMVVAAVVVAPLVEELIFRGLLYPGLRQLTGVPIAMVASGVIFGAIHWPPQVMPPLALLGIALAWIVESTGSIWPAVVAHVAFNALSVVQVLWA